LVAGFKDLVPPHFPLRIWDHDQDLSGRLKPATGCAVLAKEVHTAAWKRLRHDEKTRFKLGSSLCIGFL
jgi:hypothetical protein